MTLCELICNLTDITNGNLNAEVEIHIEGRNYLTQGELVGDAKRGDTIQICSDIDEYSEEISFEKTEVGGHDKVCICTRIY